MLHVLLDCGGDELRRRIEIDEVEKQAKEWRLNQFAKFERGRRWPTRSADVVIDAANRALTSAPKGLVHAAVGSPDFGIGTLPREHSPRGAPIDRLDPVGRPLDV